MTVRVDPGIAIYEVDGIRVYPMIRQDNEIVAKLLSNIRTDWILSNFCVEKQNEYGIPMRDDNGDPIFETKPVECLTELLKMATRLSEEDLGKLENTTISKILEEYIGISGLKKKMAALSQV
jgi:hypothetical protein